MFPEDAFQIPFIEAVETYLSCLLSDLHNHGPSIQIKLRIVNEPQQRNAKYKDLPLWLIVTDETSWQNDWNFFNVCKC